MNPNYRSQNLSKVKQTETRRHLKIRMGKKNGQEILERDESPDQACFRSKLKLGPDI